MYRSIILSCIFLFCTQTFAQSLVLTKPVFESQAEIRVNTPKLAGAISSFVFRGVPYINASDHGRELQSATSFNHFGECYNPTEAGGAYDGDGDQNTSSSAVASIVDGSLLTDTNMAYWLKPGTEYGKPCSSKHPNVHTAQNKKILSGHHLVKKVSIGYTGPTETIPNVLDFKLKFIIPANELPPNNKANNIEVLTGYMPFSFSYFIGYDPVNRQTHFITDGNSMTGLNADGGAQQYPVIISKPDFQHAMGIYSPKDKNKGKAAPLYGRFRFNTDKVTKWNLFYRYTDADATAGTFSYRAFVVFGTVEEVKIAMDKLHRQEEFRDPDLRYVASNLRPIYVCKNSVQDYLYTQVFSEARANNYGCMNEPAFSTYKNTGDDKAPLYRCRVNETGYHFISRGTNCCEASVCYAYEGIYGYIYKHEPPGKHHLAMKRCLSKDNEKHAVILGKDESVICPPDDWYTEGLLGWVIKPELDFKGTWSLKENSGKYSIEGWACLNKMAKSLDLHISGKKLQNLDQALPIANVSANLYSIVDMSNACGTNFRKYKFKYEIPATTLANHKKEYLYVKAQLPEKEFDIQSEIVWQKDLLDRPQLP